MYTMTELDMKTRRKIITVIFVSVVLILFLIVAIVVAATSKKTHENTSEMGNSSFSIDDNGGKAQAETQPVETTVETESGVFSTEVATEQPAETVSVNTTESNAPIVNTGPEDILPVALLAGAMTTYLGSAVLAKRNA